MMNAGTVKTIVGMYSKSGRVVNVVYQKYLNSLLTQIYLHKPYQKLITEQFQDMMIYGQSTSTAEETLDALKDFKPMGYKEWLNERVAIRKLCKE